MLDLLETGIDIVEIDRVEAAIARHGRRFLERVFTPTELEQSRERVESLAARFAAKEATFKALGTRVGWRDVEVKADGSGKPRLLLYGRARQVAQEMRMRTWSVSLSHCRSYAVAVVAGT